MRHLSLLLVCGALAASAHSQTTVTRYPLPTLTNTVATDDVQYAPQVIGSNQYALIAGHTAANAQVLGLVKIASDGSSTLIKEFETGSVVDPTNLPKVGLQMDGTTPYLMYDVPSKNGDIALSRLTATGDFVWTDTLNQFWKDVDWNLHPTVDNGFSLSFDNLNHNLIVVGTRTGDPALGGPFVSITRVSPNGVVNSETQFSRNANPHWLAKTSYNSASGGVLSLLVGTTDTGLDSMTTAQFSGSGTELWNNSFAMGDQSTYPTDMVVEGSSIVATGLTTFIDDRGGSPYLSQAAVIEKVSSGSPVFSQVFRQLDDFDRPGQVQSAFVLGNSTDGYTVGGSSSTYADDTQRFFALHYGTTGALELGPTFGGAGLATGIGAKGIYGSNLVPTNLGVVRAKPCFAAYRIYFDYQLNGLKLVFEDLTRAPVSPVPVTSGVLARIQGDGKSEFEGELQPDSSYKQVASVVHINFTPEVKSIKVPATVISGFTLKLEVTLNGPAPAAGTKIDVHSSAVNAFTSTTVKVPAGQTTATFNLPTNDVNAATTVDLRLSPSNNVFGTFTVVPLVTTVTPDATSYFGGDQVELTFQNSVKAPAGGINLAVVATPKLVLPGNVHFDEGEDTVVMTVNSKAVYSTTASPVKVGPFKVTAGTVNLKPLVVTLTMSRPSIYGGDNVKLTATLNKVAPVGGYTVTLKSDNMIALPVPDSIKVPAGQISKTVGLISKGRQTPTTVTVTATPGPVTATVAILARGVQSLSLSPNSILGGNSVVGTVTLTSAAPTGGAIVTLRSTVGAIHTADTVTVPGGEVSANFTVNTDTVSAETVGYVAATFNSTARAKLKVTSTEVASFTTDAQVLGGVPASATVTLTTPAPSTGLVLSIMSDKSAIPSKSVTVPAGQTSLTFNLNTIPVDVDTAAFITAKSASNQMSSSTVVLAPKVASVTLSPASIVSGAKSTMTIKLDGAAPAGGIIILLGSSNSAASVQSTVSIAGGQKSVTVLVKGETVTQNTTATISAAYGSSSASANLTVKPS